ncbi:hypothetical protein HETIRDRAFT_451620 [Heterobasidion irregulare TC 32-1]|uniref:Uncharacterized protein n=1 Tax=Heterobasidion irregulare (strain TC 32-1) TaxID=747525 RepID=W4K7Z9_HETIT|nr:uncharacterized protein HETIRDRAFT_451591 [Heterobasidion irregulare TC 32-1]XP_009546542.1 uncharacterized protein HETIRDRAFT_451620 [Heterobasidion irregulare TC 32-1]ETW81911.1 hypothetical protein HETIRDRAFT_451591 [Heterobasidion irregulare TC 32-1]ETW81952.1 hypothetical protein HETIRDRAFT_451620 [Heterobasidion irregulare TC 32-1]
MDGELLPAHAGPVIYPFASRYPYHRRTSISLSWGLFLALILPTLFRHYGLAHPLRCLSIAIPASLLPALPCASALNASSSSSSLALAFLNGASVVDRLLMGTLSDHGVAGHIVAGWMVSGATYGILAGGWIIDADADVVVSPSRGDPTLSMALFGFLMLSRRIGSVLSAPIMNALSAAIDGVDVGHLRLKTGFEVLGGWFEQVIVYVGACFAGAALV